MESFTIESVVAAARQSNELALGQILDNMAQVNTTDGVDEVLELVKQGKMNSLSSVATIMLTFNLGNLRSNDTPYPSSC